MERRKEDEKLKGEEGSREDACKFPGASEG